MSQADSRNTTRRSVLQGLAATPVAVAMTGSAASAASEPAFADMSIMDLCAIYDGFTAAQGVFLGVFNQPRTRGAAADMICDESERCFGMMNAIVEVLKQRAPANSDEREEWARTLVHQRCIQSGEQPEEFFALAAQIAAS